MGRFLAIVGAIVILALLAVYMGWFGFSSSTSSNGDREKIEVTMDKAKVREDMTKVADGAKELGRETSDGVKRIATKVENGLSKQPPLLVADRKSIELESGASTTVKVTRSGNDLKAMQLALTPSASSNLVVTGGAFNAGDTEAAIVIEAAPGAKDGNVNVEGNGSSQLIDVAVKNKI